MVTAARCTWSRPVQQNVIAWKCHTLPHHQYEANVDVRYCLEIVVDKTGSRDTTIARHIFCRSADIVSTANLDI